MTSTAGSGDIADLTTITGDAKITGDVNIIERLIANMLTVIESELQWTFYSDNGYQLMLETFGGMTALTFSQNEDEVPVATLNILDAQEIDTDSIDANTVNINVAKDSEDPQFTLSTLYDADDVANKLIISFNEDDGHDKSIVDINWTDGRAQVVSHGELGIAGYDTGWDFYIKQSGNDKTLALENSNLHSDICQWTYNDDNEQQVMNVKVPLSVENKVFIPVGTNKKWRIIASFNPEDPDVTFLTYDFFNGYEYAPILRFEYERGGDTIIRTPGTFETGYWTPVPD
jgi:hypothetical protein